MVSDIGAARFAAGVSSPATMPTTTLRRRHQSIVAQPGILNAARSVRLHDAWLCRCRCQRDADLRQFSAGGCGRGICGKAKKKNAEEFRRFARFELATARDVLIRDEVQFAAAQRGLSSDDKKLIDLVMTQYMQQRITEAGGSIEIARQKSLADGMTFEEMLHKHKRELTNELFSPASSHASHPGLMSMTCGSFTRQTSISCTANETWRSPRDQDRSRTSGRR